MTQFLVLACDGEDVLEKRMACRDEHVKLIDKLRDEGKAILGAALLDEDGEMMGSAIYLNMSEEEVQEYLDIEPYMVNGVWEEVEVMPCKIGPSFLKK